MNDPMKPGCSRWLGFTLIAAILAGCTDPQAPTQAANAGQPATARVKIQEVVKTLSLAGYVRPALTQDVLSEVEGTIVQKNFIWGGQLKQGDVAMRLSTADVERELKEALMQEAKARDALLRLSDWQRSPDVLRSERAVTGAKRQLDDMARKAADTRRLYDKGIVARVELDDLAAQQALLTEQLQSAQDELARQRELASGPQQAVARFELDNASQKVRTLQAQRAGATVMMPTSGTLVSASTSRNQASEPLELGSRVHRGDVLLRVQSSDQYVLATSADESDIASLKQGMPATVRIDAIQGAELRGAVSTIGTLPVNLDAARQGEPARYEVLIALVSPPLPVLQRLRHGMRGSTQIETYRNAKALVVPVGAISRAGQQSYIEIVTGPSPPRRLPVGVGHVGAEDAEILGNVKPGTTVALH